jgi:hypothetical protein
MKEVRSAANLEVHINFALGERTSGYLEEERVHSSIWDARGIDINFAFAHHLLRHIHIWVSVVLSVPLVH